MMSEAQHELAAFIAGVRRRWLACVRLRTVGFAALACTLVVGATLLV